MGTAWRLAQLTDSGSFLMSRPSLSRAALPSSDPAGFGIVAQDRYDFMTCKEIIDQRNGRLGRMKELAGLIQKAEASPGGFLVGAAAYQSEYVQTRAQAAAAERAARLNNCDAPKAN